MRRKHEARRAARRSKTLQYGAILGELTHAFRLADPIGVGSRAPHDEYEHEAELVVAGLKGCRDLGDVQKLLHRVFVQMFSDPIAGPASQYRRLATLTWARWQQHVGREA